MKDKLKVLIIITIFSFSGMAIADCIYEGAVYTEGTVIGPYVCSNGKWVKS